MTFNHVVNKEKRYVLAMAKNDGKMVKSIAKCSPNDTFDAEKGEALADARCEVKILDKQRKSEQRVVEYLTKCADIIQFELEKHRNLADRLDSDFCRAKDRLSELLNSF